MRCKSKHQRQRSVHQPHFPASETEMNEASPRPPGMLKHTQGFGAQQHSPRSLRARVASTCSPYCTKGHTRITSLYYGGSRETPCLASLPRHKHFQVHSEESVWFSFWLLPVATQSRTNLTLLGPLNMQMPICQPQLKWKSVQGKKPNWLHRYFKMLLIFCLSILIILW